MNIVLIILHVYAFSDMHKSHIWHITCAPFGPPFHRLKGDVSYEEFSTLVGTWSANSDPESPETIRSGSLEVDQVPTQCSLQSTRHGPWHDWVPTTGSFKWRWATPVRVVTGCDFRGCTNCWLCHELQIPATRKSSPGCPAAAFGQSRCG